MNNIKNIVTSKFKVKLWCEKDLEAIRKIRYYKEVINPTLEDQKYLCVLTSLKEKFNIAKIRTNSHYSQQSLTTHYQRQYFHWSFSFHLRETATTQKVGSYQ